MSEQICKRCGKTWNNISITADVVYRDCGDCWVKNSAPVTLKTHLGEFKEFSNTLEEDYKKAQEIKEYGKQPNLEEILQDLVSYCAMNTTEEVKIKLTLPKNILYQFSLTYKAKESAYIESPVQLNTIARLYLMGGIVEFVEE